MEDQADVEVVAELGQGMVDHPLVDQGLVVVPGKLVEPGWGVGTGDQG